MAFLSSTITRELKNDLYIASSVTLFIHLVQFWSKHLKKPLFNDSWKFSAIGLLIGFAFYHIVLSSAVTKFLDDSKTDSLIVRNNYIDIFKFTTVFGVREFITAHLVGRKLNYDKTWALQSGFTILGYVVFNTIQKQLPIMSSELVNNIYIDTFKLSLGSIFSSFIINNTLTYEDVISVGGTFAGTAVYNYFLRI